MSGAEEKTTKETIYKYLGMLAIIFNDKKTSDEFFAIYHEFLKELPEPVLINGIKECIANCRFFPTIAEIKEKSKPFMNEYKRQLSKQYDERMALAAFNQEAEDARMQLEYLEKCGDRAKKQFLEDRLAFKKKFGRDFKE